MARPPKMGLDYFPLDVNFLNDLKTKKLVRSFGASAGGGGPVGFIKIYKDNGYYAECDEDFIFLIADDLKLDEEYTKNVIEKMVEVDFFNKNLYENHKILTSIGIQKRYILASGRRVRSKINSVYDLINTVSDEFMLTETEFLHTETLENDSFCIQKYTKEKKRKEKKRNKIKEDVTEEKNEIKNLADEPTATTAQKNISEVFVFYENHFGMTSDYIRQSIIKWCNDLNPALVKRALEIAVEENVLKFRYANAILVDWANKGIDTLEKALAENNRRQQPKQYSKPRGFVENVPDWANRPQQPKQEKPIDEDAINDLAEKIARLKTSKGAENEQN